MNTYKQKQYLIQSFFIVFLTLNFLVVFSSCDTIKEYSNEAMKLVGLDSSKVSQKIDDSKTNKKTKKSKKKSKKDKIKSKTKDNDQKNPLDEQKLDTPKEDAKDTKKLTITKEDQTKTKANQSTKIKAPKQQQPSMNAPINIEKRLGGTANKIIADDHHIYLDFPQSFAVYDKNFKLLARHNISFPIQDIKRIVKNGKVYLYLKEEQNVLEVFELIEKSKTPSPTFALTEIKSFEVEGDFYWINENTLLVYLNNKIQFLDLSDFDNIKIINEIPIGGVTDALLIGKHIYLSRQGFLDIISLDNYDLTSSLRIGSPFGFLEVIKDNNSKHVLLSLLTSKGELFGLQHLKLSKDASGVTDFGTKTTFKIKLENFYYDKQNKLIIGREVSEDHLSPAQLYSITHNKFLRGPISLNTKLSSWFIFQASLYLIDDKGITKNSIKLDEKVIAQSASVEKIIKNKPSNVPLAQIGAAKLVKDEYLLTVTEKLNNSTKIKKVMLLSADHFAMIEENTKTATNKILATTTFSQEDITLHEPVLSQQEIYTKHLTTDFGIFLFSEKNNTISLLDVDFKKITPLSLKLSNMISWAQFRIKDKDILAITTMVNLKNRKYAIYFYELKDPQDLPLISKLYYNDKPFVFYVPVNQVVILTSSHMDLYTWERLTQTPLAQTSKKKKREQQPEPTEVVTLDNIPSDLLSAKISPSFDKVYTLFKTKEHYKIFVLNIFNIKDHTTLDDFDIRKTHFEGSSFAKDGRLFILPSKEGTLFYDMTKLSTVKEISHWPIPSYCVDVAMRGQFMCAALGYKGVMCGKLLF